MTKKAEYIKFVESVLKTLDVKARKGCDEKSWVGFQNGDGEEVGKDIERIISQAKKLLK